MKKIITPAIFLVATLLTSACTDTDDLDVEEEPPTDTAACCAPDAPPRGDQLIFDSFDAGRRARERFDWLQNHR